MKKTILISSIMSIIALTGCDKKPLPDDLVSTNITGWERSGFKTVLIADFEIVNKTDKPVKDITILCEGYSVTKTFIDRNQRVVYVNIPVNHKINVNRYNMGFVKPEVDTLVCATMKFENSV